MSKLQPPAFKGRGKFVKNHAPALPKIPFYVSTGSGVYQLSTTGTGMIAGMVVDSMSKQAITGGKVSNNIGGIAMTLDGYYLMITPAGVCTVTASAQADL